MQNVRFLAIIGVFSLISILSIQTKGALFKDFSSDTSVTEDGETKSPNFVLVNKSKSPIWISLSNEERPIIVFYKLYPKKKDSCEGAIATLDLSRRTHLIIKKRGEVRHVYNYSFERDKTIYVAWTARNRLEPQIGEIYGLFAQNKCGLMLNRNVQPGDIYPLEQRR